MFVVTGDEKARLQFFRDMIHQKVNNQKLLETYVGRGGFCIMYNSRSNTYDFIEKWKRLPENYVNNSRGWNLVTEQGRIWNSYFMRQFSRADIFYYELSQATYENHYADFQYIMLNSVRSDHGNQTIINSALKQEATTRTMNEIVESAVFQNPPRHIQLEYIHCLDKGDFYVYHVFDEDYERPYEKGTVD